MQQQQKDQQNDALAGKGHGPQGVDKAPGEEPSQDNVNFAQEAFKGKKVDADPSKENERPPDHQDV